MDGREFGWSVAHQVIGRHICRRNVRGSGLWMYMGVSKNRGKTPQIIHFNRVFHYKPSILEVFPLFLESPISIDLYTLHWAGCSLDDLYDDFLMGHIGKRFLITHYSWLICFMNVDIAIFFCKDSFTLRGD